MAKPKLPSTGAAGSAAPPVALLTHAPSPGLYSRLERAVESLPPIVKVDGLRNRLQKYKEGVSGWELDPVMEGVGEVADTNYYPDKGGWGGIAVPPRKDISRKELLDIVHRTSPAFTHRQGYLAGTPDENKAKSLTTGDWTYAQAGGPLGSPTHVGPRSHYRHATEPGVENYREQLLFQPDAPNIRRTTPDGLWIEGEQWDGGHWRGFPSTIAHMRLADAGDALRLVELQSDIRNANVRHAARNPGAPDKWPRELVPLYDAYPEVFLKSLLLEGAQGGYRAIEVPPLDMIGKYVSMRPSGIQHVYGQQVPNTLIKAAKPLGGLIEGAPAARPGAVDPRVIEFVRQWNSIADQHDAQLAIREQARRNALRIAGLDDVASRNLSSWTQFGSAASARASRAPRDDLQKLQLTLAYDSALADNLRRYAANREAAGLRTVTPRTLIGASNAAEMYRNWPQAAQVNERLNTMEQLMPQIAREWESARRANEVIRRLAKEKSSMLHRGGGKLFDETLPRSFGNADGRRVARAAGQDIAPPSRRLEISDALRKRIIEGGIGLSVLLPLLSQQEER